MTRMSIYSPMYDQHRKELCKELIMHNIKTIFKKNKFHKHISDKMNIHYFFNTYGMILSRIFYL